MVIQGGFAVVTRGVVDILCPCDSGLPPDQCCAAFISGARPPRTPGQLMRSRYTAFTQRNVDYLIATWHPDCEAARWRAELTAQCAVTQWRGLVVKAESAGRDAQEGYVEFIARFFDEQRQRPGFIHERSRFVRMDDRWYYVDGLHKQPARNEPCPCGSGNKYKKCCGR
ncbi:YchJ family protein [Sodalis sp. RH23]|uniref:YchJ family protein n=1 Tax=unclassified Sodalis (in: enterobacteria) TaxID=2636512 RepID=UPI0039B54A9B